MATQRKQANDLGHYQCSKCHQWKEPSGFSVFRRASHGLSYSCKDCEQKRSKDAHYRCRYGISEEQRKELINKQDNKCACCGSEFNDTARGRPVIDHCHSSGQVRDIICDRCNITLGLIGDDTGLAKKLIDYLARH